MEYPINRHLTGMKFYITLGFILIYNYLPAQDFSPFNRGYVPIDSIAKMNLKSENIYHYYWTDTLKTVEQITNIYDTAGNCIRQTYLYPNIKESTVMVRNFDSKNRMTEDSRYYYPDIPISKNMYTFNDDTFPHKMEIMGYMYSNGVLDNFSKHISLYNDDGHLLDYKIYDRIGKMAKHEKYIIGTDGIRTGTISFSNNDDDSIFIYPEEDYGLPFNNPISDYNSLVRSDTTKYTLKDGSVMLYIYESNLQVNIDPDLVEIKIYNEKGLIREIRKINQYITKYEYVFWK